MSESFTPYRISKLFCAPFANLGVMSNFYFDKECSTSAKKNRNFLNLRKTRWNLFFSFFGSTTISFFMSLCGPKEEKIRSGHDIKKLKRLSALKALHFVDWKYLICLPCGVESEREKRGSVRSNTGDYSPNRNW